MMPEMLANKPPYVIITTFCLIASVLICLVGLVKAFTSKLRGHELSPSYYPSGYRDGAFPRNGDYIICIVMLCFMTPLYLSGLFLEPTEDQTNSFGLSIIFLNTIIYLPVLLRFFALPAPRRAHMDWLSILGWLTLPIIGLNIININIEYSGLNQYLIELTQSPALQEIVEAAKKATGEELVYMIIASVVIAPICEEILFRGFIYNCLKRACGMWPAILASSLLFGAIHTSLLQILPLSIFAILLCLAYERAQSIWLPIAIHAIFNGISVIAIICLPMIQQYVEDEKTEQKTEVQAEGKAIKEHPSIAPVVEISYVKIPKPAQA